MPGEPGVVVGICQGIAEICRGDRKDRPTFYEAR